MRITSVPQTSVPHPRDVDLSDPAFYATGDPHSLWAQMRAHHPLHRQELSDGRGFLSRPRAPPG